MKLKIVFVLAILLSAMGAWADEDEAIAMAQDAALSWLSLTDQGQLEQSWTAASSLFKSAISSTGWVQALQGVRPPLGKLNSRNVASSTFARTLPGAPDGEYVVFQFKSSFENKTSAIETVTMMKDPDGTWRAAGYFIK